MNRDSLRLLRNILLRSAAVCYIFLIVSALVWVPLSGMWTGWTSTWYHMSPEKVHRLVIDYFTAAKFYAMFVLLAPGLGLHWTIKRDLK